MVSKHRMEVLRAVEPTVVEEDRLQEAPIEASKAAAGRLSIFPRYMCASVNVYWINLTFYIKLAFVEVVEVR